MTLDAVLVHGTQAVSQTDGQKKQKAHANAWASNCYEVVLLVTAARFSPARQ